MPDAPAKTVWPCINYADAPAAIEFLQKAFGFEATLVVPEPDDKSRIAHAELRWPEGGGVMLGTADPGSDSPFKSKPTGAASVYVVTDHVDELYARATAAGARVVRELADTDYGSRDFAVLDPEGNVWDFGTYRGAPAAGRA